MVRTCVLIFVLGYLALVYQFGFSNIFEGAKEKEVVPAPLMPKNIVLELPPSKDNPRNSEGDFIRLESGSILYIYTHYYGGRGDDHAAARLCSRITQNNGASWSSEDEIVLENEGALNIMSVSLLRLRDRSIALFYLVKENAGDCRPYLRYTYDEGKSWTKRIQILPEASYNVVNNSRAVLLTEGRIILPVARHRYLGGDVYNYESKATVFCLVSDDGGRHWSQSENVPNSNNIMYQEPGVVELSDGRLLMTIRTGSGRQYYSYSEDRGATWSETVPSPLISPVSPATIKRAPGRDSLVAIWNESPDRRDPLTIAVLSPNGSEILAKKTLDRSFENEVRGYCYSSLFFVDTNTFLAGYCCGTGYSGLNASRIIRAKLEDVLK